MADRGAGGASGHGYNPRELLLAIAEQRHTAAVESVAAAREAHPADDTHALTNRIIRQCAKDLAIAGAMSGGAAASPAAGPVGAAAVLGAEGALNAARLGEMVMAIGVLHGHTDSPSGDRALWLAAALGASESTVLGLTGMAARAGVRGGAQLLGRVPSGSTAAGTGVIGRTAAKMSTKRGPWGLAALLPYTLGASVGAAGNLALAVSVGRAATRYFATDGESGTGWDPNTRRPGDDRSEPGAASGSTEEGAEVWEAEFLSERFLDES
jgi:hypothetical protein